MMAIRPDAQDKLRKEVSAARAAKGDLDFDELMELPYLDAICKETLRVYPPVDQLYRT
jgi:cytochrome P450